MRGRHTTAIPRVASSADFIRPTQGFDCHISVLPPSKSDSLQSQFDRSQVHFLFFVIFIFCAKENDATKTKTWSYPQLGEYLGNGVRYFVTADC